MSKDSNGKVKVEKAGLKEVTREGFEYELTCNLELDIKHNATALKDRTGLFMDKPQFVPSEQTGILIKQWCETGVDLKEQERQQAISEMAGSQNMDELKACWTKWKSLQADIDFTAKKDEMKEKLSHLQVA